MGMLKFPVFSKSFWSNSVFVWLSSYLPIFPHKHTYTKIKTTNFEIQIKIYTRSLKPNPVNCIEKAFKIRNIKDLGHFKFGLGKEMRSYTYVQDRKKRRTWETASKLISKSARKFLGFGWIYFCWLLLKYLFFHLRRQ